MTGKRLLELLAAEYNRHIAMAAVDPNREVEHIEVAAAIAIASAFYQYKGGCLHEDRRCGQAETNHT